MIPKIIWQTYKTKFEDLPFNPAVEAKKWKEMNPDYEYKYFDDDDVYNFIEQEYGVEMLDIVKSFKVPVMMADLWRYLVIYKYGGVYADIDTECKKPLSEWLNTDLNMIIAPENGIHYVQYFFAAEKESPVIKSVIDLIVQRCKNVDYEMKEFVHYHTGPAAFTDGIRAYFNLRSLNHRCKYIHSNNHNCFHKFLTREATLYKQNIKMVNEKFFCYSGEDQDMFKHGNVRHHFGSHYWKDTDYQSWVEDPIAKKSRQYDS